MKVLLAAALLVAAGCVSRGEMAPGTTAESPRAKAETPLVRKVVEYEVVWAKGRGRIGYLQTQEVSRGPDTPVPIRFAYDNDFRELGWIGGSGKGVRYDYEPERLAAAHRSTFQEITLPPDTAENQVRRIFALDPLTDIRIYPATEADLVR